MSETLTFAGQLCLHAYGEADDILYLSTEHDPVAELLETIHNKTVTCRYWITDKQCDRDAAQEQFIKSLYGAADVDFGAHYSELTGYLWTDEEAKIGGHDLIQELKSHVGRWIILEIEVWEGAR